MELNESQKQFINADSEFIRLLAPAGAGKTASLLHRCVRLVTYDAARRILIVTFTRVARAVLQERIKNDAEFALLRGKVEVSTLNSLGFRMVKNEHSRIAVINKSDRKSAFYNWMKPVWDQKKYERIQKIMSARNYLYSIRIGLRKSHLRKYATVHVSVKQIRKPIRNEYKTSRKIV